MIPIRKYNVSTIILLVLFYFSGTDGFLDARTSSTTNNLPRTYDKNQFKTENMKRTRDRELSTNEVRSFDDRRLEFAERSSRSSDRSELLDRNNNVVNRERTLQQRASPERYLKRNTNDRINVRFDSRRRLISPTESTSSCSTTDKCPTTSRISRETSTSREINRKLNRNDFSRRSVSSVERKDQNDIFARRRVSNFNDNRRLSTRQQDDSTINRQRRDRSDMETSRSTNRERLFERRSSIPDSRVDNAKRDQHRSSDNRNFAEIRASVERNYQNDIFARRQGSTSNDNRRLSTRQQDDSTINHQRRARSDMETSRSANRERLSERRRSTPDSTVDNANRIRDQYRSSDNRNFAEVRASIERNAQNDIFTRRRVSTSNDNRGLLTRQQDDSTINRQRRDRSDMETSRSANRERLFERRRSIPDSTVDNAKRMRDQHRFSDNRNFAEIRASVERNDQNDNRRFSTRQQDDSRINHQRRDRSEMEPSRSANRERLLEKRRSTPDNAKRIREQHRFSDNRQFAKIEIRSITSRTDKLLERNNLRKSNERSAAVPNRRVDNDQETIIRENALQSRIHSTRRTADRNIVNANGVDSRRELNRITRSARNGDELNRRTSTQLQRRVLDKNLSKLDNRISDDRQYSKERTRLVLPNTRNNLNLRIERFAEISLDKDVVRTQSQKAESTNRNNIVENIHYRRERTNLNRRTEVVDRRNLNAIFDQSTRSTNRNRIIENSKIVDNRIVHNRERRELRSSESNRRYNAIPSLEIQSTNTIRRLTETDRISSERNIIDNRRISNNDRQTILERSRNSVSNSKRTLQNRERSIIASAKIDHGRKNLYRSDDRSFTIRHSSTIESSIGNRRRINNSESRVQDNKHIANDRTSRYSIDFQEKSAKVRDSTLFKTSSKAQEIDSRIPSDKMPTQRRIIEKRDINRQITLTLGKQMENARFWNVNSRLSKSNTQNLMSQDHNDSSLWLNAVQVLLLSFSIAQIICKSDPKKFGLKNLTSFFNGNKEKIY